MWDVSELKLDPMLEVEGTAAASVDVTDADRFVDIHATKSLTIQQNKKKQQRNQSNTWRIVVAMTTMKIVI